MFQCFNVSVTYNCVTPVPSTYITTNECVNDSIYFSHHVSTPTDIIRFLKKSYTDNVKGLIKCFNYFQLLSIISIASRHYQILVLLLMNVYMTQFTFHTNF